MGKYPKDPDPAVVKKLREVEHLISDSDGLFHGVPKDSLLPNGRGIKPSFFSRLEMSVDRDAEASNSAKDSFERWRRAGHHWLVARGLAGACREIPNMTVAPDPEEANESREANEYHALVYGRKTSNPIQTMFSLKFSIVYSGDIVLDSPPPSAGGQLPLPGA